MTVNWNDIWFPFIQVIIFNLITIFPDGFTRNKCTVQIAVEHLIAKAFLWKFASLRILVARIHWVFPPEPSIHWATTLFPLYCSNPHSAKTNISSSGVCNNRSDVLFSDRQCRDWVLSWCNNTKRWRTASALRLSWSRWKPGTKYLSQEGKETFLGEEVIPKK